jgi:hypothetical protein
MGGGKSSGSSAPVVTEEQKAAIRAQTDFLTGTALPAYQQTISGAKDVYGQLSPYATQAAKNTYENAAAISNAQQGIGGELANFGRTSSGAGYGGAKNVADVMATGGQNLATAGTQGLMSLFSPNYKTEQIQASLQPAREAIREQQAGQNAMYGAAGGLGSSRMALADKNLSQLGQQRLQSAAAQTSAAVEAQRQQAANTLLGTGTQGLTTAGGLYGNLLTSGLGSATAGGSLLGQSVDTSGKAISAAQSPMDLYNKYASVVYGTPQASTTPNFAGTQGQNTSSKGFGFKI